MKNKQLFKQYKNRLAVEGIIKSTILGLIIGLGVNFITAFVSWFFGYDDGTWLAIGLGLGTALVSGVILYFGKFRPTAKSIARRVDGLGLEERIVTMMELENDESYIAMRQREDAKAKLAEVNHKQIRFNIAKKAVAWAVSFAVAAPAMTVVCELAARGILNSGLGIINPDAAGNTITITYVAEDGGWIDGEEEQILEPGETPTAVVAEAEDGWMFVGWDDGHGEPYRLDKDLTEDAVFTAMYEEVEDDGDKDGNGNGQGQGEGNGNGQGQGEGDGAGDMPGEPQPGNGNGNGENSYPMPGEESESAGGKSDPKNQVHDGKTPYQDVLPETFEQAMEMLTSGESLPDSLRSAIEQYFESIGISVGEGE